MHHASLPLQVAANAHEALHALGRHCEVLIFVCFVFGLYEAGNVIEAPLKAVMGLIAAEDMSTALAADLAALVDEDVPTMIK